MASPAGVLDALLCLPGWQQLAAVEKRLSLYFKDLAEGDHHARRESAFTVHELREVGWREADLAGNEVVTETARIDEITQDSPLAGGGL